MKQTYEVLNVIRPFFDTKNDHLVIKIKDTVFCCQKERWYEYVISCSEDHWRKVNDWINNNIMPYMTRKSINYKTINSYGLKHECECAIGNDVAEELLITIITAKGIYGENKKSMRLYPTTLYFPLSSKLKL